MPLSFLRRSGLVAASMSMCVAVTLGVAPAAAESPATGQLSAIELLDPAWTFPKAMVSFGIVYTTTDQHGASAQASGALYLPPGLPPEGGWPLVVWAHGTAGTGDACAPSRRPQSERNTVYFDQILENGYAVLAPDYQGLGTRGQFSYYNANVEGMSILDAVAAMRATPFPLSRSWVVVGQSEGAHAAMSAAGLYSEKGGSATGLSGVVVTGLRTDPSKSLPEMFRRNSTGSENQVAYAAYYLASLEELNPGSVTPYLSDFGKEFVEKAAHECLSHLVERADGRRPSALVVDPDRPTPTFAEDVAALTGYPEDRFTSDLRIGYGTADIDVPPTDTEDYGKKVRQLNTGIQVTIQNYPGQDHSGAFLASLPDTLAFLHTHLR